MSDQQAPISQPMTPEQRLREVLAGVVIFLPGLLLGALPCLLVRRRLNLLIFGTVTLLAGTVGIAGGYLRPGWELMWLLHLVDVKVPSADPGLGEVGQSLFNEAMFGPLWLYAMRDPQAANLETPKDSSGWLIRLFRRYSHDHPEGKVRLAFDRNTHRPVDLTSADLGRGVFIVGSTGSAKSSAIARIVDGVAALPRLADAVVDTGGSIAVSDGKGPSLKEAMREISDRHGLPFFPIDPDDPATYTLNPLDRTPTRAANALIGGLIPTATSGAAFYKQQVQGAAPYLIAGLQATGKANLSELQALLQDHTKIAQLARLTGNPDLRDLAEHAAKDRMMLSSLHGMAGRLRALTAGQFRSILLGPGPRYVLDLTNTPSITYTSLPTLEAVADTALMARLDLADKAQLVADRLKAIQRGEKLPFLLLVLDELTALSSADPEIERLVVALMLQCRAAHCGVVVAGQSVPDNAVTRNTVLSAGCLISLRVAATDSDIMVREFGTNLRNTVTQQTMNGVLTGAGTVTQAEGFRIRAQELRDAKVGEGVLCIHPNPPRRIRLIWRGTKGHSRNWFRRLLRRFR